MSASDIELRCLWETMSTDVCSRRPVRCPRRAPASILPPASGLPYAPLKSVARLVEAGTTPRGRRRRQEVIRDR